MMIVNLKPDHQITAEEYLKWEEEQPLKYEYLDGQILNMAGGSLDHNQIAVNILSAFLYLRNKGCRVLMADAKVQVSKKSAYHYPDVVVTCHEADKRANDFIKFPCLIVEVLSPSTAYYDQTTKFKSYRRLTSLTEYVLVDSQSKNIEIKFRKDNQWESINYSLSDSDQPDIEVHFQSINLGLPLSSIYKDVSFDLE